MVELQHRFTVPAGIDRTWEHFNDIEGVAGCFPGATVTEADAESFSGTVKVKLGPIALVYNGTGTFVEKDEAAHRMVIDAKGKDKRGNGTAGATVTATMTAAGPDSTDVEVLTDLNITGKAAQFGRGNVMKDVSDKLLGQFVACLEQRLSAPDEAAPAETSPEEAPAPEPPPGGTTDVPPSTPTPVAATPPPAPAPGPRPTEAKGDDSLDLGAAVLPVLLKAYWKPAVAALAVLAVIWWWVARD